MKKILLTCFLCLSAVLCMAPEAQSASGNLVAFGDSFLDSNYYCQGWYTPLGACSNYRNILMRLAEVSPYTLNAGDNFAVGSTTSGGGTITVSTTSHPAYPGYSAGVYPNLLGQIAEFNTLGRRISGSDLVVLTYAGNDIDNGGVGTGLAVTVAGNLSSAVNSLILLGGRNFILMGGMPFDEIAIGGVSLANMKGVSNADDRLYYTTLNSILPQYLSGYESEDVHIRILDAGTVASRVIAAPERYGFLAGDCLDAYGVGCLAQPLEVQNRYAFFGGHPTDAFSLLLAEYALNILNSAAQVPFQAELARDTAKAFYSDMLDRMTAAHARGPNYYKEGKLSFFVQGGYAGGQLKNSASSDGADWGHGVEKAGAEYVVKQGLHVGAVAGFTSPKSELGGSLGSIKMDSCQLGLYASAETPDWFGDAALGGALNSYRLNRAGIVDTLSAETSGGGFWLAAQGGRMFGTELLKFGPVAGVGFSRTTVKSYDESGDIVLAQNVAGQKLDSLTGWAGLQLVARRGQNDVRAASGRAALTAEHEFLPGDRNVFTTGLDPASAVQVITPVSCGIMTYGKLAVGTNIPLSDTISADVSLSSTLFREDGNRQNVGVGLSYAFN